VVVLEKIVGGLAPVPPPSGGKTLALTAFLVVHAKFVAAFLVLKALKPLKAYAL
jgi:hypothetical protein